MELPKMKNFYARVRKTTEQGGETILEYKQSDDDTANEEVYDEEVVEEGQLPSVSEMLLWGITVFVIFSIVKKAFTKHEPVKYETAKRDTVLAGKTVSDAKEIRLPPKRATPGVLQPGWTVTIKDPLSEFNHKQAIVTRTDGNVAELNISGSRHCHSIAVDINHLSYDQQQKVVSGKPAIVIKYALSTERDSITELRMDPFTTIQQLKERIASDISLNLNQFRLISQGEIQDNNKKGLAWDLTVGTVIVYVIQESLKKGWRAPEPQNPKKTEEAYSRISQYCDDLQEQVTREVPRGVQQIEGSQLAKALVSYDKVIVDFYAPWCGPCRNIAPFFDRLSESVSYEGIAFISVNADASPHVRQKHNVTGYPTFMTFLRNTPVGTISGAGENDILDLLDTLVNYK
eukprot:TRINITY_DN135_c8_g1_i1.p1 TRINITY_DN135_c8_g1~~TRINITY_DN135_c8_g1_i1.p1  ORF type:complete len:402 (+),score=76.59 TRINITY_DN135_c8_g1_i1:130-1335(+)